LFPLHQRTSASWIMWNAIPGAMALLNVHFRVFCHATEDEDKVAQALKLASGLEDITREVTEGYHGNPIIILEAFVKEKRRSKDLFSKLSEVDLQEILVSLDRRMDDDCNLYLRLDKQEAYLGNLKMTTSDDAIAIRAKVESYPKKRENAMKSATELLEAMVQSKKG
jgi:RNA binding exosome subunit